MTITECLGRNLVVGTVYSPRPKRWFEVIKTYPSDDPKAVSLTVVSAGGKVDHVWAFADHAYETRAKLPVYQGKARHCVIRDDVGGGHTLLCGRQAVAVVAVHRNADDYPASCPQIVGRSLAEPRCAEHLTVDAKSFVPTSWAAL